MPEGKFISCIYPVHIFYVTGVKDVAKGRKKNVANTTVEMYVRSYECFLYAFGDVFFL